MSCCVAPSKNGYFNRFLCFVTSHACRGAATHTCADHDGSRNAPVCTPTHWRMQCLRLTPTQPVVPRLNHKAGFTC